MKETFADKVIKFNKRLEYKGELPNGFQVLNPYLDNLETTAVMQQFYQKYYNDSLKRKFIIGINPGRHGAGVTGIPFTDTKRLQSVCAIEMKSVHTHEVSSVFVYDMIAAYGGAEKFFKEVYINSLFPLAIIRQAAKDKWVNANYYDDPALFEALKDFMVESLKINIGLGLDTDQVFVLGKKNAVFLQKLNKEAKLFKRLTILEHPRYIQQYKSREKDLYIDKYILALNMPKEKHINFDIETKS
ncbi:MAG TPA: SMUG2 DNA glycosylase family protein [Arachidicoccus soli]|nr:SMUG2 DNA glycosylase family protein [Arachidicoccus soli]